MPIFNIPAQTRSSGLNVYGPVDVGPSTFLSFGAAFSMPVLAERTSTAARFDCWLEVASAPSTEFEAVGTAGGWRGSTALVKNSTVVGPTPAMTVGWPDGFIVPAGSQAQLRTRTTIPMSIGATITVEDR